LGKAKGYREGGGRWGEGAPYREIYACVVSFINVQL